MTLPLHPVLWVGRAERPEIGGLLADGIRVERATSFLAAVQTLGEAGASPFVVFVESDELSGRESERFAALRDAGAAGIVGIYPPAHAWRADRAAAAGADYAVTLPAWPGVLASAVRRLSAAPRARPRADEDGEAAVATAAPRAGVRGEIERLAPGPGNRLDPAALDSVIADVAVLHRNLEDVERMLDHALHAFARRSGAERCSILMFDRLRTGLRIRRSTSIRDIADAAPIPGGRGLAGHVAVTGTPLRIDDIAASPFAPVLRNSPPRDYRTPSCLLLPLRGSEDVVGVVCLADKSTGRPFTEAETTPLAFFADRAGQALENGEKFRHLQELAAVDELTGLANRRQFQAALEREVQRARRYDRPLSLAILDLDHFKLFNDRCGHQAGDRALAAVGEILRTSLREVDVVARYGGEEFAVILPETAARGTGGARNPFPFLERLRRRIEETHIPGAEKLPAGKLTISGGVACFPDDATTVEDLVREADQSLYVSKSRGRNVITYRDKSLAD